jgi:hypothetical protein
MTWKKNRPEGVPVSIASVRLLNWTPCLSSSPTRSTSCLTLRPWSAQRMPCAATATPSIPRCCSTCRRWVGSTSTLPAITSGAAAPRSARASSGRYVRSPGLSVRFFPFSEATPKHAAMMDGKLLLVTNAPDFTPEEVVKRYKSLADIERGFRVLKSEIEIGPIYHRLPDRIHAHAAICFMALILYRVMRSRLRDSHTKISPERALDKLRRIQHQVVKVNDLEPIAGLSSINREHTEILQALTIKKPTLPAQLAIL